MTAYYMLITSLPRHYRQYKIKETPISRIQLEKRLKLLTTAERNLLNDLTDCLWTSWFEPNLPFQATMAASNKLLALKNPFINELIHWIFDIRSVLVALRIRKTQTSPPTHPRELWSTRWHSKLIKYWSVSDFGLKYVYPWLPAINEKLANNDTAGLEDIFLTVIWKHLESIEARHYYDFEAVIIYLMRWHIVNYWSQFNEKTAYDCIRELTDKLFAESHIDVEQGSFS